MTTNQRPLIGEISTTETDERDHPPAVPAAPSGDKLALAHLLVDDVLAVILATIIISGGDRKADSLRWWHKAVRMAQSMRLHQLDSNNDGRAGDFDHNACLHSALHQNSCNCSSEAMERVEEKRRVMWLLFALDRHWALSFNSTPLILDQDCCVYLPLPDSAWKNFGRQSWRMTHDRVYGPGTTVTGTGFFEFFLPLMAILGDIIRVHHTQCHPRLGNSVSEEAIISLEQLLDSCMDSIDNLASVPPAPLDVGGERQGNCNGPLASQRCYTSDTVSSHISEPTNGILTLKQNAIVGLYAAFIIHVMYVLLYGRWDALSMLSPDHLPTPSTSSPSTHCNPVQSELSDWITSTSFAKCSSHAICACEIVSDILRADPELAFMPYLFGIYLLQGSFVLLFFAHRMPQVGQEPNASVEKACETIIQAHEVCLATLSVEFQKDFRKVLRAVLYSVRERHLVVDQTDAGSNDHHDQPSAHEDGRSTSSEGTAPTERRNGVPLATTIWRQLLGLYRWTNGSRGLAV